MRQSFREILGIREEFRGKEVEGKGRLGFMGKERNIKDLIGGHYLVSRSTLGTEVKMEMEKGKGKLLREERERQPLKKGKEVKGK